MFVDPLTSKDLEYIAKNKFPTLANAVLYRYDEEDVDEENPQANLILQLMIAFNRQVRGPVSTVACIFQYQFPHDPCPDLRCHSLLLLRLVQCLVDCQPPA